ncbi:ATP-binding protein [Syntrophothermus lipocalidus]|uniref:Magnesium chelatase n=1 Tax=Syntrophothermus lipocalidus (strain DSM 12680 / TGB-C1) TaxID=643648 RepID=D7CMG0_SYNLT|nr:magnesium chelatase [Syntrophothermus lipocalidus]ADI01895.1 Magnesium chelatase [Syntrophothermus lipocalidus DSM 12680]
MKRYAELSRHDGNQTLFDLVEMSIASTYFGEPFHIHAEGLRGTGKTTIMRAARDILPTITRIKGCLYNCNPSDPHCPNHRGLSSEEIAELGVEQIMMPLLEISHSAKVGTVAGSIDLAKITDPNMPEAALLPGILPQAHRGIIFIDEINRLADTSPEITDILLDVMGQKPGRLQIEEAGLPVVEIPLAVTIWAASNPDEEPGPLEEVRRQLSDRFDMVFYMGRPASVEVVAEILSKSTKSSRANEDAAAEQVHEEYRRRILEIAEGYAKAELPDYLRNFVARIYVKHNLESLRAIEAIQQGALLYSLLKKRKQPTVADVVEMVPLALKHRVEGDTLVKIMNSLEARSPKESILSLRDKTGLGKQCVPEKEQEETDDTFLGGARRIKDMSRSELIATEKTLNPQDF